MVSDSFSITVDMRMRSTAVTSDSSKIVCRQKHKQGMNTHWNLRHTPSLQYT